jgi:hypothetical protein
MQRNLNEIRAAAATFAADWKDAHYERGQAHTFYIEFFALFGVSLRRVAAFEEPIKKLGDRQGFIDLFWKGVLLVEHKSAGGNLVKAKEQALSYFPSLKEEELPRYLLICDFQFFELYDLDEGLEWKFPLSDLPRKIQLFDFIRGVQQRVFRDQDPVNIKASNLMADLHDGLAASGYTGHALERFLVRLLFCLFADDTGIFEQRDIFHELIEKRTNPDGSDTGQWITHLFQILNTEKSNRERNLDEDLAQFPFINGDLFGETLSIPSFDSRMRMLLIKACEFNWEAISPAIFGSLFQVVLEKKRRATGSHYTTEKNILKVIQPLFIDALAAEFARLKTRRDTGRGKALEQFHEKLASFRFFDPACGCGNFLIITYRELRLLEIDLLKELHTGTQLQFDVAKLSKLNVDRFYGIEINEFPARIAEVALWMMDHIMNNRLSLAFGENYARIPLITAPNIVCDDALEIDWNTVLPSADCSFILGNPPFIGSKMQSELQRAQVKRVARISGAGTLDYVAAWFLKAAAYVEQSSASIGFVATNSITQGEQVAQLWPLLFERYGLEIAFAHRTFAWGSDARGMAHVHVVILGLTKKEATPSQRRLFNYEDIDGAAKETLHTSITAYLFDGTAARDPHLVVDSASRPITPMPTMKIGSKPIDGGNYIFEVETRYKFLSEEPSAKPYLHPYVGSEEFINGGERWILYLKGLAPDKLRSMPHVVDRIEAVRKFRSESKSGPTRILAADPTDFHVTVVPKQHYLAVPKVSSERRAYIPIGYLSPPTIPSDLLFVVQSADLSLFSLLSSRMHMAWLRHIGGRLKSDYRYSIGIVYNPFPFPELSDERRANLASLAQSVLDARALSPNATLADLYDPRVMPKELRKAHEQIDLAVDQLYRRVAFASDMERVEHLFGLYSVLKSPVLPEKLKPRKRIQRHGR